MRPGHGVPGNAEHCSPEACGRAPPGRGVAAAHSDCVRARAVSALGDVENLIEAYFPEADRELRGEWFEQDARLMHSPPVPDCGICRSITARARINMEQPGQAN